MNNCNENDKQQLDINISEQKPLQKPLNFSNRSEWMRNWVWWEYYRDYFPARLVKTADLPATSNYLFCVYPHGILSSGAFCSFASNATNFRGVFPGLVSDVLTLSSHFWMPFSRELMHGLGK